MVITSGVSGRPHAMLTTISDSAHQGPGSAALHPKFCAGVSVPTDSSGGFVLLRLKDVCTEVRQGRVLEIGTYGSLSVGAFEVSRLQDGISKELLAVFQDDMMFTEVVPSQEYRHLNSDSEVIPKWAFRASGAKILGRLTALGVTRQATLRYLDESIASSIESLTNLLRDEQLPTDRDLHDEVGEQLAWLKNQTASEMIHEFSSTSHRDGGQTNLRSAAMAS